MKMKLIFGLDHAYCFSHWAVLLQQVLDMLERYLAVQWVDWYSLVPRFRLFCRIILVLPVPGGGSASEIIQDREGM